MTASEPAGQPHDPAPGTFYMGGTYARCAGCGGVILWACVGDEPTAWRGGPLGTTSPICPGGEARKL